MYWSWTQFPLNKYYTKHMPKHVWKLAKAKIPWSKDRYTTTQDLYIYRHPDSLVI